MLGPVRFGYFQRVLTEELKRSPQGMKALDVGCGGGLLAEEFARLGCQVTGMDPSEPSLATARRHARESGLEINYLTGVGERMPFPDSSFDIVVCCDVLEHVSDASLVVQEIGRVLATGGIFFYETINRTFLSWLTVIYIAQQWKVTRFLPPNLHDWKCFINPRDLQFWMHNSHLQNREVKGLSPRGNPFVILSRFLSYKRGEVALAEVAKQIHFRESKNLSVLYMGHALKQDSR